MSLRRLALTAAAGCALVLVGVTAWDIAIERPRLGGNQVCVHDASTAKLFDADGPGVWMFDRKSGRPARITGSMAFAMVISTAPPYSGYRECGFMALRQSRTGLFAGAALAAGLLALVVGLFSKRQPPVAPARVS